MYSNDTVMTYNTNYHLYVLNHVYLKQTYEIDFVTMLGSETKAKNKMLQISRRIYNYLYNHKQRNKRYWEYYLAMESEVRDTIQKALIEQALFEYETNGSALTNSLGINPLNGITLSLRDMRGDRTVALEAINTLRNFKDGILFYTGKEMYLPDDTNFDYTEQGY